MTKKCFPLFLVVVLLVSILVPCPLAEVRAAEYKRDENYVDLAPGDVDIWDNGKGISVSGGGQTYSVNYWDTNSEYIVLASKYLDQDGGYTTQVDIFFYRNVKKAYYNPNAAPVVTDDGSSCFYIYIRSFNGSFSTTQGYSYCVKMRDGLFLNASGNWVESPVCYSSESPYTSTYTKIGSPVFSNPFFAGKYQVYSSYDGSFSSAEPGFPVNLLPNAPLGAGTTEIPYKTTFRMLSGDNTVYNTFYYTSSFQSGEDTISASGTIRCDATKLSDGSITRTVLSAPQLLCQISSYGSAYDIAYTNDDNLCELLGISKPAEKYWDVAAQEWKPVSSGGGGSGTSGPGSGNIDSSLLVSDTTNLSQIKNLTVKLVGEDALIDAVTFNDYFAGQVFHTNKLEDLNTPVWGLGNYLTWDYDGIKYETTGSDSGPGGLLNAATNNRRIKMVIKAKFRLDSNTTKTLTYTLHDYDSGFGIAVGVGSWKVSFYDLCLYFQEAYPEYVTDFPTQLQQISYYLTPFYYDKTEGKYHYGSTSRITQNVKSALADYSGGEWDGDDGGWSIIEDTSNFEWNLTNIKNQIANGVSSVGRFLSGVLGSAENMMGGLGEVPALLSGLFSFLPSEIIAAVGVGLSLWLLPALLGLARTGLKAIGGMCSTLFGFITSFFG